MGILSSVNLLAVFAAAIVGALASFLWYSDLLFVKKWMELSKISIKQMEDTNMLAAAGMGFGITVATSFCVAFIYHYCGSLKDAFMALELIILLVAIDLANALIWEKMPFVLYLIKMGHKIVSWAAILLTYGFVYNLL